MIGEHAQSGLSKKAFCEGHGINLGTFHGWGKRTRGLMPPPRFAEVEIATYAPAALEVLLPNGVRIGIRHQGSREELVALVRGVAGC